MCILNLLHVIYTPSAAATPIEVAVSKGEAKSSGVHVTATSYGRRRAEVNECLFKKLLLLDSHTLAPLS